MRKNRGIYHRFFLFNCFFILYFALVCSGCKSIGSDVNRSLIEHSIAVERSQSAQRELIGIIDRAEARLDAIERTAGSLSNNLDRLGELFAEYDSIVRDLIAGLKSVEAGLGGRESGSTGTADNSGNNNFR